MKPILFSVERLSKRYGDNTVVDDLSFQIAAGECLGVIGPNGAGKTTTIRMCLGQSAPDTGSTWVSSVLRACTTSAWPSSSVGCCWALCWVWRA